MNNLDALTTFVHVRLSPREPTLTNSKAGIDKGLVRWFKKEIREGTK